jgi:hypothetical protein
VNMDNLVNKKDARALQVTLGAGSEFRNYLG